MFQWSSSLAVYSRKWFLQRFIVPDGEMKWVFECVLNVKSEKKKKIEDVIKIFIFKFFVF
jgi:hypothetical protein